MVTFVKGNIFDSPAQVLTNPINCVGVMGKGLAKAFASKFPEMEADYKALCTNGQVRLGQPYLWEDTKHQILNFPTKDHWKQGSDAKDIRDGLDFLANHYDQMGIGTIAIPALGCGLGGLEWSEVRKIILEKLEPISDLHAFVYEPNDADSSQTKTSKEDKVGAKKKSEDFVASPV